MFARIGLALGLAFSLTATAQTPPGGGYVDLSSGTSGSPIHGYLYAMAVGSDGSLYAGGTFETAAGTPSSCIARREGAEWVPFGDVSGPYCQVRALAVGPDGSLYAGGTLTTAGGVAVSNIARWDGSAWSSLGSGVNGQVWALALGPDGSLYAGGTFTTAGGRAARGIARWDGAAWHALGGGVDGNSGPDGSAPVHALAVGTDGTLYAGGVFTRAGGVPARNIARWDGTAWSALGSGFSHSNGSSYVSTLAVASDGTLYAGGYFNSADGVSAAYVARWNGATWRPLGSGPGFPVYALAVGPDGSLYAGATGGGPPRNVTRWDGETWSPLGNGVNNHNVNELAVGPDGTLYAGGYHSNGYGVSSSRIARWDGAAWNPLGSEVDGPVHTIATGPDGDLYAGGTFTTAGEVAALHIAHWNGTTWSPLGSGFGYPNSGTQVQAVAVGPDGSLYAGGTFTTAGDVPVHRVARWDGMTWSPLGSGVSGSISTLAVAPDGSLYAGGPFTTAGGVAARCIARWDGEAWSPLGSGVSHTPDYTSVNALAVGPDGSLYAGGLFTIAGDVQANFIARWDGSAWSPLANGVGGHGDASGVLALAVGPDGSLYAGGYFTTAGDLPAHNVARWDGAAWHALGSGVDGYVLSLAVGPDGSLYAGGQFTVGEPAVRNVARWDGSSWSALNGIGPDGRVNALAMLPTGALALGGAFTFADGVHSPYVTLNTTPRGVSSASAPSPATAALTLGPNPARGPATARADVTGDAIVTVHDALGRLVATPFAGTMAGRTAVRLPDGLPPGVYVVRLAAGDAVQTARLVVVR